MPGRRERLPKSLKMLEDYKREQIEARKFIIQNWNMAEEGEHAYVFYAGKNIRDTLVGIAANMAINSGLANPEKPVIILADSEEDENLVKAQARTTERHSRRLAPGSRRDSGKLGGEGGGMQ